MKLFRRLALLLVATSAFCGALIMPFASSASADQTDIYSPVPTGLLRVCIVVHAADASLCIHL